MPVNYYSLGPDKQLNEVVIAGSHDAGITKGGGATQTQGLDIGEQAAEGVRVFDLRIAAAVVKTSGVLFKPKEVELKAYHGALSNTKQAAVQVAQYTPGTATVTASKAKPGTAFGEGLVTMLEQARDFVRSDAGKNEFLILKFDKCMNWALIGEACRDILDDKHYRGGGNLNTRTLKDLKGSVVTVFPKSGLDEIGTAYGPADGMLGFKNLSGGGAYVPNYDGLQYYGKGGTAVANEINKIGQNVKKQTKLMTGAQALKNPQIVGMLYWTTTGSLGNIKSRNKGMWTTANVAKFQDLWEAGLGDYLKVNMPVPIPTGSPMLGPTRKRFMPNIVMIDFADAIKCRVIRDLNDVSAPSVASMEDLDF